MPSAKTKRVPIRTCVSCRRKASKRELLRVVASAAGGVSVDAAGGRLKGRGAYLCAGCRAAPSALRRGRLEYALRTKIAEDKWNLLLSEVDRV